MANRGGRRENSQQTDGNVPPPHEDDEHAVDLNDYEAVAHAENREEADFYRRLLGEHEIEVLFSDDLDDYEREEGAEGIAIFVPEEEVDTAYHLIKDHEEYVATGGILRTDDEDEDEEDPAAELTVHPAEGYSEFDPLAHDDDDPLGMGGDAADNEPPLEFDDVEHP